MFTKHYRNYDPARTIRPPSHALRHHVPLCWVAQRQVRLHALLMRNPELATHFCLQFAALSRIGEFEQYELEAKKTLKRTKDSDQRAKALEQLNSLYPSERALLEAVSDRCAGLAYHLPCHALLTAWRRMRLGAHWHVSSGFGAVGL